MQEWFRRFAVWSADMMGSPWMFVANVVLILIWFVTGPLFRFSDTWQLVVNTGTTVFTYLAVFLIQNTQNRDAKAIHLKLDELIRTTDGARNGLVNLQELTDEELEQLHTQFEKLREKTAAQAVDESLDELQEDVEQELGKREEAIA
jgi:low affinity Fe/Cu permease